MKLCFNIFNMLYFIVLGANQNNHASLTIIQYNIGILLNIPQVLQKINVWFFSKFNIKCHTYKNLLKPTLENLESPSQINKEMKHDGDELCQAQNKLSYIPECYT